MRFKIKKCPKCGEYTLKETCPLCGEKTKLAHPPKFSPEDPYGEYRRRLKKETLGIGVKK
ncbi:MULTISPECIES: RNA-protein complex protein Nop10 [Thermococcus]|uniref:Ribosome biogenesis protein Nop10 n=2 Tax=Thermococcus sibiricus TaxID=172049 RepID=NOP10_THESM|nr:MULTISPECIES: RNA-protein complex protein Nop10 [Thermococcus]C6A1Z6.1 RecName: Full=Ribosome biogenesis protein Nop10 [Thermococcus sibiricus MM 739]KUK28350.1 MAG: Ribosome biogenesis protein Nop10 [Thermococcus sp. 40_45]HII67956.1 RNA-protein complex protein Nop10 [Thermococcaceae archaeon]ACS89641.1 Ribosome biogenesis protein Nop10 [Thermococcus sibiricus MM 739]KUK17296.1 MAG: Ribosome biogenesis protein Nop10 [Thermococcus sibiricus]MBC7094424.1 RNA-protein complex protein Nop10 [T